MLHPDLSKAGAGMPRGVLRAWTLTPLRLLTAFLVWKRKPIAGITISMHTLPGSTARVRVMRPAAAGAAQPVLLWVHGGGYVMGTAAQDDAFCARVMAATGVAVVSVDYRLAPEHPWPAALDDCSAALDFIHREGPGLGLDVSRLIVAGQSAGGGLAAALVLRLIDSARRLPLLQMLVYPMLDDRTTLRRQTLDVRLWDETSNLRGWRAYLGQAPGGAGVTELMAPARRADLQGSPPTWIGVGSEDLFHDEDVAYAQRLKAAGVPCTLEVVEGAFHGFDGAAPEAPVSQRFFAAHCEAIRQALAST